MTAIRAILCDVYHTIFHLAPAPADADVRWLALARERLGLAEPPSMDAVSARCREIVAEDHAAAKGLGISHPEVSWPDVMRRALPDLGRLGDAERTDFLFEHMRLQRTLGLMLGAADFLREAGARGIALGIISNAQAYTLRELREVLASGGLTPGIFDPALCLWSYQCGYAKPNPHLFRMIAARLADRGIAAGETLMIGDRLDNDIEPARLFGWRAWRLQPATGGSEDAGPWDALRERVFAKVAQAPE
jgi:putative hydrolase of the HAD superfamily